MRRCKKRSKQSKFAVLHDISRVRGMKLNWEVMQVCSSESQNLQWKHLRGASANESSLTACSRCGREMIWKQPLLVPSVWLEKHAPFVWLCSWSNRRMNVSHTWCSHLSLVTERAIKIVSVSVTYTEWSTWMCLIVVLSDHPQTFMNCTYCTQEPSLSCFYDFGYTCM